MEGLIVLPVRIAKASEECGVEGYGCGGGTDVSGGVDVFLGFSPGVAVLCGMSPGRDGCSEREGRRAKGMQATVY